MLISQKELLDYSEGLGLSQLKLAYLVLNGILPTPLKISKLNSVNVYLFDDCHTEILEDVIKNYMGFSASAILERTSNPRSFDRLLNQDPGMSQGALSVLESAQNIWPIKIQGGKNRDIRDFYQDVLDTPNDKEYNWFTRLQESFPKIRLFKVKLTPSEQLEIIAQTAVLSAMVPDIINEFFFQRVRPTSTGNPRDKCLKYYLLHKKTLGWGMFDSELEVIKAFEQYEPKLKEWSLTEAFNFIDSIESECLEVEKAIHSYRKLVDPEGKLTELIVMRSSLLSGQMEKIAKDAVKRTKENYEVILSNLETEIKSVVRSLIKTLLG